VFENRILRRIFGPKGDEVTGGWRKLHNKELYNLYTSPSIIRMIKSMMMRWAGHVALMGVKRNGRTTQKTRHSIVEACLPHHCILTGCAGHVEINVTIVEACLPRTHVYRAVA
jgi:hypothetical protein